MALTMRRPGSATASTMTNRFQRVKRRVADRPHLRAQGLPGRGPVFWSLRGVVGPPVLLNSRLTAYRAGGLQSVRAALLCRRVRRDPPELCPQRALQHSRLEIRTADSRRARCTVAKIANRRLFDEFAGRETVANSPRRSDGDASRGGFNGYQAESSAGGESDSKNTNAHGRLHSVSAPKIGSVSQN
jgi:hypothetical protein